MSVNLKSSYSKLNESLTKLFDESGIHRSFTVPYVDGQPMADHVASVHQAATQSGGLTGNIITTAHHSGGKGWGSGDGHTVGHPAQKLRETIIPKDDENAKAAIAAAQKHLNNIAELIGEKNPAVMQANGQLALVKKTEGAGMNLLDFGVLMTQIMFKPTQAVAKAHSGSKQGGHAPQLRGPEEEAPSTPPAGQETASGAPGEAPGGGEASPATSAAPAAQAAAVPQAAPSQAQG